MPQFKLNAPPKCSQYSDYRCKHRWCHLDTFAKGYVEAMFFTNGDTCDVNEHKLNKLGVERLTKASTRNIAKDCEAFQALAQDLLERAYARGYAVEQAGHDFWFTRQRHGTGFWDRSLLAHNELGDKLTACCRAFSETNVYVQNGWIYVGE